MLELILALLSTGSGIDVSHCVRQGAEELATGAPQSPTANVGKRESFRIIEFEGFVFQASGQPAVNAVVVTSAGGQVATDELGRFRLSTRVSAQAQSLRLTAVGAGAQGLMASTNVTLSAATSFVTLPGLTLAERVSFSPSWIPTFGAQPGTDGGVRAMSVYDDGRGPALYVAGEFGIAGGLSTSRIARWNGSKWESLGAEFDGIGPVIESLKVFDDGGGEALYVSGRFSFIGSVEVSNIARWDGNSWSDVGGGTDSFLDCVFDLEVFDDGGGARLYAGGDFFGVSGLPVRGIAKFDGTNWGAVGPGFSTTDVQSLQVYDDGNGEALYAAGHFYGIHGDPFVPARGLAKWDGSIWTDVGGSTNGAANVLAVYDDGNGEALYVGGFFTEAGGIPTERIAKWDGTSWSALGSGAGSAVYGLGVYDDGQGAELYVSGNFAMSGGVAADAIARWDGSNWSAVGSGANAVSYALTTYDDGNGPALFAGGFFSVAGGKVAHNIARWQSGSWTPINDGDDVGLDGEVKALAVYDDGTGPALFAGGNFTRSGNGARRHIAKWNGIKWKRVGDGFDAAVHGLAVFDDGNGPQLYATGGFRMSGTQSLDRMAKWDGTAWTPVGGGLTNWGYCLTVVDDGTGDALYVGGAFNEAGGNFAKSVARWDGTNWSGMGSGVIGQVFDLTSYDDGTGPALHVAGNFVKAGTLTVNRVAKWDGAAWSSLGTGLNGTANALTVMDVGGVSTLFVGGEFNKANGSTAKRVAGWDGANWSSLGTGIGQTVHTLTVHDDGTGPALYAGGQFTTVGNTAVSRAVKWDGSNWIPMGSGMSGTVTCSQSFDDGNGPALYMGGEFESAYDAKDSFVARWARRKLVDLQPQ